MRNEALKWLGFGHVGTRNILGTKNSTSRNVIRESSLIVAMRYIGYPDLLVARVRNPT